MKSFWLTLATGLGVGLLPGAPGTYGSLLALIIYVLIPAKPLFYFVFLAIMLPLGVLSATKAEVYFHKTDPSQVVIDEILGMWLALFLAPKNSISLIVAFILFRLFDILKPPPIKHLERLPQGLGIIADDLMAGLYALLVRQLIYFVM